MTNISDKLNLERHRNKLTQKNLAKKAGMSQPEVSAKLKDLSKMRVTDLIITPIPTYEEAVEKLDEVLALDGRAEASAEEASESAESAETSAGQAEQAKNDAVTASEQAITAKNTAVSSASTAQTAATTATQAKTDAETAASQAYNYNEGAWAYCLQAGTSATRARNSATSASGSASSAEQSAQSASASATLATEILENCEMKSDLNADVITIGDARYEKISDYELIETITVVAGSEPTTIVRNQIPNGTAYDFSGIVLQFKAEVSDDFAMVTTDFYCNETVSGSYYLRVRYSNGIDTNVSYSAATCDKSHGRWFASGISKGAASPITSLSSSNNVRGIGFYGVSDFPSIKSFRIMSSGVPFPAGSTISIYARR